MKTECLSASYTADKLYQRWRKRVFPNDGIRRDKSLDGYEQVIITRGNREFIITLSLTPYENPNFMVQVDEAMRGAIREWKKRSSEVNAT